MALNVSPANYLDDDTDIMMGPPPLPDDEAIDPRLFPNGVLGLQSGQLPSALIDRSAVSPRNVAATLDGGKADATPREGLSPAELTSQLGTNQPAQFKWWERLPPPGPDQAYQNSMNQLEAAYGQRPQLPQPKWWQRVIGAGAGFGAGWSNAASRSRNPIDIGAMEQNILAPGYSQKLARWQSRVQPAQAIADIEGQKQASWWKNQQAQAQMQYLKAHADYMEGLGRGASIDVTPEMEAQSGGIFKVGQKVPASTATEMARIAAGKYEKPERSLTVTDPDIAKRIGVTVGTPVAESIYREAMKPTPPEKPLIIPPGATYFDPTTGKPIYKNPREFAPERDTSDRPAGPKTFSQIENRKSTRLLQAEGASRKRVAAGDDPDQVAADLSSSKQQIQNDYENEVNAAGGAAQHFDYGAQTPAAKGGTVTPPPAAAASVPPTVSKTAAAPPSGKRISVKLPDGRFLSGTEDQFRKAGIPLANR